MKKLILILGLLGPWMAKADSFFYDQNGNYAGQAIGRGGLTHFYDGNGNPAGSAMQSGGITIFYDENGNPAGEAIGD